MEDRFPSLCSSTLSVDFDVAFVPTAALILHFQLSYTFQVMCHIFPSAVFACITAFLWNWSFLLSVALPSQPFDDKFMSIGCSWWKQGSNRICSLSQYLCLLLSSFCSGLLCCCCWVCCSAMSHGLDSVDVHTVCTMASFGWCPVFGLESLLFQLLGWHGESPPQEASALELWPLWAPSSPHCYQRSTSPSSSTASSWHHIDSQAHDTWWLLTSSTSTSENSFHLVLWPSSTDLSKAKLCSEAALGSIFCRRMRGLLVQ